jgi:pyrroline-5-carboxylate reductase
MLSDKTIGFIGCGNLATAVIRGLISSGAVPASRVFVNDLDPARLAYMAETQKVVVFNKKFEIVKKADIIIIAVKPGDVDAVLREIAPELIRGRGEGKLLISVAAGVRIARLLDMLGADPVPVVRAMPNLPVIVRKGATGLVAGPGVDSSQMLLATAVFKAVGAVVVLSDEKLMDAVTALSGSGPAYIYLVLEALIEAGIEAGIPPVSAKELVLQTALGAAAVALDPEVGKGLEELREMVTSPGGTTAEALKVLGELDVRGAFKEALRAATKRSVELSGEA